MAAGQGVLDRLSLACSVCKTEPLEKLHYVSHVLGKRHQKNLKNRSKALRKDEMARTLHITGFKKDTPAETILGAFYRYEVVNISPFPNYCFVELRSRQTVQQCLDEEHYVGSQKLKVSLRHQSQQAESTSSPPIRLNWRTQMALGQKISSAQSQWHAIDMLIKNIELKRDHYEQRDYLRTTLENFLRPDFPVAVACVFGSSANNLGFVGCDVDLYVHLGVNPWSAGSKAQKEAKARDLTWYLARKLKNSKRGFKVQAIAKARVPIVKFEDALTHLQVDLSFRNGMPVYNTQLICQYTRTHMLVRPYLMVIRYWAKIQEIAGGGQPTYLITNYGFTMLMLFYLMVREEPLIPSVFQLKAQCPQNIRAEHTIEGWDCSFGQDVSSWANKKHNVTVLELVCEFFEYYGKSFDPRKWVISPLAGRLLDKSAVKERDAKRLPPCMEQYYMQETDIQLDTALCLQDPFEHSYNITRGLQAGPLTEFQYKCRKAAEICNDIISQERPLGHLFEEVFIDESILSSIQASQSPLPKEVDITQEEIITLDDDSDEVSQGDGTSQDEIEVLNMDPSSLTGASTSSANGKLPKWKAEEEQEIEICPTNQDVSIEELQPGDETNDSSVEEIPNGEAEETDVEVVNGNGAGEKKKVESPLLGQEQVVSKAMPEKNFFKFFMDFSKSREFTITFDGCISGGKDVMKSEDDIGHAASSLIHFVLQQCLKMEVNPTGTPSEDRKRKSQSPERTGRGKRIKNADGNVVNVVPVYRKLSEYRCSTENQLWVGRKKASKTVPKKPNTNPLQYEMAVTEAQMSSHLAANGRIGGVSSNGQTLELVVTLWQKLEKPSEVMVTGDSLSNNKLTQGMMMPLFLYLAYLAPSLLEKVSMYIVRTSTKR
ncbi:speckle targeted PIP5K1A-regulated poly(A) polymerase-like [Palaemon carinicauda]|uniref:speckle targeted PIP5K1A-regulated poly(A) polymerase-like n=1 Tax=Palaemon carinicauda TaxID=392227 RepID=UPI0035B5DF29